MTRSFCFRVADAVLAVVNNYARHGEQTQDWLRARVATLEAALRRIVDVMNECHLDEREPSYDELCEWDEAARAALGEQEPDRILSAEAEPRWRARETLDDRTMGDR